MSIIKGKISENGVAEVRLGGERIAGNMQSASGYECLILICHCLYSLNDIKGYPYSREQGRFLFADRRLEFPRFLPETVETSCLSCKSCQIKKIKMIPFLGKTQKRRKK